MIGTGTNSLANKLYVSLNPWSHTLRPCSYLWKEICSKPHSYIKFHIKVDSLQIICTLVSASSGAIPINREVKIQKFSYMHMFRKAGIVIPLTRKNRRTMRLGVVWLDKSNFAISIVPLFPAVLTWGTTDKLKLNQILGAKNLTKIDILKNNIYKLLLLDSSNIISLRKESSIRLIQMLSFTEFTNEDSVFVDSLKNQIEEGMSKIEFILKGK